MPASKPTRTRKTPAAPAPSTQPAKRAAPARRSASRTKAPPPATTPTTPPSEPPVTFASSPSDEIPAPSSRPSQANPLHRVVDATPRQIEADAPLQPHRASSSAANRDRMRDVFFPSARPESKPTP